MTQTRTVPSETDARGATPRKTLSVLSKLRSALRRSFFVDGVVTLSLGLLLVLGVSFLLDYFARLPWGVRCVFFLGGLGLLLREIGRKIYRPLALELPDEELAVLIERSHPELRDALVTAVEMTRRDNDNALYTSTSLLDAVVRDVEQRASRLRVQKVFDLRLLRWKIAGLALLVLCVLVAWRANPPLASVWAQRNLLLRDVSWPKLVRLRMVLPEGSPIVVAVGDDLPVAVEAVQGTPSMVIIRSAVLSASGRTGAERVDTMAQSTQGLFRKTFANVARPFEFSVEGGDDALGPFSVEVRLRPRIDMQSIRLWFEYPEYLGMTPTPREEPVRFGNVKVPVGTRVRFSMSSNVPVEEVFLVVKGRDEKKGLTSGLGAAPRATTDEPSGGKGGLEVAKKLAVEGGRRFSGEFTVTASGHYHFQLAAADGFRSDRPDKFRMEAIPDRAPDVKVVLPERLTEKVTATAKVQIVVEGADDYGVKSGTVEGNYFGEGNDEGIGRSLPLEASPPAASSNAGTSNDEGGGSSFRAWQSAGERPRYHGIATVDIGALGTAATPVTTGARFQFFVELSDFGGNVGESAVYYLRVVDADELTQSLNNRLMVVRDWLDDLLRQQESSRKDVETFQEETSLKGAISSKEAHRLFRFERDQTRIRSGLERESRVLSRILQRAVNNNVGDKKWRDWVQGVHNDLHTLAGEKARSIETALRDIKKAAEAEPQETRELQRVISRQMGLEDDLEMLILQLSEYGDINALIQRLRDIRRAQTELRDHTRSFYENSGNRTLPPRSPGEGGPPREEAQI